MDMMHDITKKINIELVQILIKKILFELVQ